MKGLSVLFGLLLLFGQCSNKRENVVEEETKDEKTEEE